ncbi:MAG: galactose mutarotase [Ruminococcaceae bacterium]|nr:galactose mutarotase [Oscillospiraceae bacterium]
MKTFFGTLPSGETASLYTIRAGRLTATVSDFGATLISLLVPDRNGVCADVVLGYGDPNAYAASGSGMGATVGRNANRLQGAAFTLNGQEYRMDANDNGNNLHSGFDHYHKRLWTVAEHTENAITFALHSPHGDQGFPGNADVRVEYRLDPAGALHITYDAVSDEDTVFNLTNHSYFNLAGHDCPEKAMEQLLSLPGRFFTAADAESIPTGELRPVAGTPMDFRVPKPIGRDINADYDALNLQGGYDHNWEVFCNPCATLTDPDSGRTMAVYTDCPGIQFYAGNYLDGETGKGGVTYPKRSGICLETQYYPDAIHHPQWPQPITKAGQKYHSETVFKFN